MREGTKLALEIVCFTGPLVLVITLLALRFQTWSIFAAAGSCLAIHGVFWLRARSQWTHAIKEFEARRAQRDLSSSSLIDGTFTASGLTREMHQNRSLKKLVDS